MIYNYFVYIMSNTIHTVLYTGVTNNLHRRIAEHKMKLGSKFTRRYQVHKLLYYEIYTDPENAIKREKQIKGGSRQKKINLIKQFNAEWKDLSKEIIM